jgi:hypothetical protein
VRQESRVSVEAKWIELFDKWRCISAVKDLIAAPFLSVPAAQKRTVLYVGKATAKDWYRDDDAFGPPCGSSREVMERRIKERRECTQEFLNDVAPSYNSGFWGFAREVNTVAAGRWNVPLTGPLQHITWTNICKIGTLKGNPSGFILKEQSELAIDTLRSEISAYDPQLICFVTWDYAWNLVKEALSDSNDASWDQMGNDEWMWYHPPRKRFPAALLTGHPERKRTDLRKRWLARISELLARPEGE